ncbi:hypothetical protein AMIS_19920 [Actinoplanes missouriensis 431]|uniref:Uncharacterized protein n=1 Tax=Actinoplanes missouriensis (strain ATCC 14538 / DSM 43046 / CBS 188.64 / JCM 3121 / NBRC 102363 / NCIMB 12654 / NRRL B-3342 / UNCC 431) TaxID=512565 RepID=I0H2H5_ACTM4|nr:hypothetical protein [Actinoplanes missouriensis]BAL87212.1 hypothetical protein AMIS_19920 [Actinoplanes missouriensis 431]
MSRPYRLLGRALVSLAVLVVALVAVLAAGLALLDVFGLAEVEVRLR